MRGHDMTYIRQHDLAKCGHCQARMQCNDKPSGDIQSANSHGIDDRVVTAIHDIRHDAFFFLPM